MTRACLARLLLRGELTDLKYSCSATHSARERGYKNRDEINVSKAGLGDIYEEKIKGFFR